MRRKLQLDLETVTYPMSWQYFSVVADSELHTKNRDAKKITALSLSPINLTLLVSSKTVGIDKARVKVPQKTTLLETAELLTLKETAGERDDPWA